MSWLEAKWPSGEWKFVPESEHPNVRYTTWRRTLDVDEVLVWIPACLKRDQLHGLSCREVEGFRRENWCGVCSGV